MIDTHTLTLAFLVESVALLLLVLGWILHTWLRHQRQETEAARRLISQVEKAAPDHSAALGELLAAFEQLPQGQQEALIGELIEREKALYHQVLQLFLSRDSHRLGQLAGHIRALQEPYRQLLKEVAAAPKPEADSRPLQEAQRQIEALQAETQQLADQLQTALETIDTLSAEYTRMFAPDRSREELEASRRRIVEMLKRNEAKMRPPQTLDDDLIIEVSES
ncbi:DNA-damage-inducible protein D [Methylomarinovum caldicuralii]|uniref:DNA-damage-inducible protein D n=1 Tax=Methylomarinovum caldicuralii TaxID=438856 RepID=A0AAU9BZ51_9GAMM|nr:hypothetical protein [Methylomarinovum caldicuralii]BCX80473.1 DNA-damage-inducible protein D [Methylomarinovum caldicuralii]